MKANGERSVSKHQLDIALAKLTDQTTQQTQDPFRAILDCLVRMELVELVATGDNPSTAQARTKLEQEAELLRANLDGENPTALEQLLADQITTCYAFVTMLDLQYLAALPKGATKELAEFWANQSERATRRLTRSIAALVNVRRVQVAAIQVNIGDKQLNVSNLS